MGKIELLKEILDKQKGETELERFYNGIQNGQISFVRLRNASIIREYDRNSKKMGVMRAYNEVAEAHCVSAEMARKIISDRGLNEI